MQCNLRQNETYHLLHSVTVLVNRGRVTVALDMVRVPGYHSSGQCLCSLEGYCSGTYGAHAVGLATVHNRGSLRAEGGVLGDNLSDRGGAAGNSSDTAGHSLGAVGSGLGDNLSGDGRGTNSQSGKGSDGEAHCEEDERNV